MGIVFSTLSLSSLPRGRRSFSFGKPSLKKVGSFVYEFHKPRDSRNLDADIVFFHGFPFQQGGCSDAYKSTWLSDDLKSFWPQTLLAKEFSNSRIFSVRYNDYDQLTLEFDLIENDNVGVGQQRPVVLIAHCFGGFVIKKLLNSAMNKMESSKKSGVITNVEIKKFFENLRGIFFYATPHLGIAPNDKSKPRHFSPSPTPSLMKTLNDEANQLHNDFQSLKEKYEFKTTAAFEMNETRVRGDYVMVVNEPSATLDMDKTMSIPDSDHFSVCRPVNENSVAYQCLSRFINEDCEIPQSPATTTKSSLSRASSKVSKVFSRLLTPPASKK